MQIPTKTSSVCAHEGRNVEMLVEQVRGREGSEEELELEADSVDCL